MKKIYLFTFCLILIFIVLLSFEPSTYCATPKIVTKLTNAFENIEDWFLKLATPAAAVAVGTGVFMKNLVLAMRKELEHLKK